MLYIRPVGLPPSPSTTCRTPPRDSDLRPVGRPSFPPLPSSAPAASSYAPAAALQLQLQDHPLGAAAMSTLRPTWPLRGPSGGTCETAHAHAEEALTFAPASADLPEHSSDSEGVGDRTGVHVLSSRSRNGHVTNGGDGHEGQGGLQLGEGAGEAQALMGGDLSFAVGFGGTGGGGSGAGMAKSPVSVATGAGLGLVATGGRAAVRRGGAGFAIGGAMRQSDP